MSCEIKFIELRNEHKRVANRLDNGRSMNRRMNFKLVSLTEATRDVQ